MANVNLLLVFLYILNSEVFYFVSFLLYLIFSTITIITTVKWVLIILSLCANVVQQFGPMRKHSIWLIDSLTSNINSPYFISLISLLLLFISLFRINSIHYEQIFYQYTLEQWLIAAGITDSNEETLCYIECLELGNIITCISPMTNESFMNKDTTTTISNTKRLLTFTAYAWGLHNISY